MLTLCEKCAIDFWAVIGYNKNVPREIKRSQRTNKKNQKSLKKVLTNLTPYGIIKIQKGKESQEKNLQKKFEKPLDNLNRVWYNKDTR